MKHAVLFCFTFFTSIWCTLAPSTLAASAASADLPSLSTPSQARIINLGANMSNRLDALIARLDNISQRLAVRISLASEPNSTATAWREKADSELVAARAALNDIDAMMAAVASASDPVTAWRATRLKYETAITAAHEAKHSLITALGAMSSSAFIEIPVASIATSSEPQ